MPEREIIETGVLVAIGGAVGHFLSYLLRLSKLKNAKDERVTDETFEYANMIRIDMDNIKKEMAELRKENVALKTQIANLSAKMEALYKENMQLVQMNREHAEICLAARRISEEKGGA